MISYELGKDPSGYWKAARIHVERPFRPCGPRKTISTSIQKEIQDDEVHFGPTERARAEEYYTSQLDFLKNEGLVLGVSLLAHQEMQNQLSDPF